jgi:hypothetical protein
MDKNNSMPTFLMIVGPEGERLINLNQIQLVDEIKESSCRLWLSGNINITLNGKGADDLLDLFGLHSIMTDGTPYPQLLSVAAHEGVKTDGEN